MIRAIKKNFRHLATSNQEINLKEEKELVIVPLSRFLNIWTILLTTSVSYYMFIVPFDISFGGDNALTLHWAFLDGLTLVLFFFDILVHANTAIR